MTQTPATHIPYTRSLRLTRLGMFAERLVRAFWPLWSIAITLVAILALGLHDHVAIEVVWLAGAVFALGLTGAVAFAVARFRLPRRQEALNRLDAHLPGRPLSAIADTQAIGAKDRASVALWQAHQTRMARVARDARPVAPDLRLSDRDPLGLRYIALTVLALAMLFGSVWRVGSVAGMVPVGGAGTVASGPVWEGWVEPPAYTGLPTLYLNEISDDVLTLPEGSRVILRLYGEVGALTLRETVSGAATREEARTAPAQSFILTQAGRIEIEGRGGHGWQVEMIPDLPPEVEITGDTEAGAGGEMILPFAARDDYGVVSGTARITLDLANLDRRHGLAIAPEPRDAVTLDLPMPITGDRSGFEEKLIEDFSKHPWANLPVRIEMLVRDDADQQATVVGDNLRLAGRRFFDPLAAAVIEQRRDLLWSRENGGRVAQILRAISNLPDGFFRSEVAYLRLRMILRRLEASVSFGGLQVTQQAELAEAMWTLALMLEDGTLADALEQMRQAQERLSEAMKNGASDQEIARLMQELRDATQNYMRQLAQQQQGEDQQTAENENTMTLNQEDLQRMMDRIQELMEQGRMAEAQQALEEFQRMMENMRMAQGSSGQGQPSPGQQAMEGLAETLRDQQGLSDEAFRDLQDQFNPDAQSGQSQQDSGRNGADRSGEPREGQQGQGQQGRGQPGNTPGTDQSLADRQQALRQELERQRNALPGLDGAEGEAARDALDRAGRAMEGAEDALRSDDMAGAIDQQSEAMEALREGMRNLGEAMAQEQGDSNGQQGQANGAEGGTQRDPLGRSSGANGRIGSDENLLQGEDVYRRARDLLDEIRRRSGEGARPETEREYLRRLLDRF